MPKQMRVLCTGDEFIYPESFERALEQRIGPGHEYVLHKSRWPDEPFQANDEVREYCGDEEEIAKLVPGIDLWLNHIAPVTERVLDAADRLVFIGTPRGGPVNVNIPAATRHGVVVANVPGRNAQAVAEWTIGALIAGQRHIAWSSTRMREGDWTGHLYRYDQTGKELAGQTVGLVGLGQIGSRVATMLRGFGVHLLAHDPYVDPDVAAERGVELVDLDELLERSDVVSLHARVTPETRGMFSKETLQKMRPGAYFVNGARGELVDETALIEALKSGHLSGAALDVYAPHEPPLPDNPLLKMPNVVAVSHLAGASKQVADRAARRIAAEAARFVRGEPLKNVINPQVERRKVT